MIVLLKLLRIFSVFHLLGLANNCIEVPLYQRKIITVNTQKVCRDFTDKLVTGVIILIGKLLGSNNFDYGVLKSC